MEKELVKLKTDKYRDMVANSADFKQGQEDYKNHNVKHEGVPYKWYKAKITKEDWKNKYSKTPGYTHLSADEGGVYIGFQSVMPLNNCLEITNMEELRLINMHRKMARCYPLVFEENDEVIVPAKEDILTVFQKELLK